MSSILYRAGSFQVSVFPYLLLDTVEADSRVCHNAACSSRGWREHGSN